MPLLLWVVLCAAFGGIASAAFAVIFIWIPAARSARLLPHLVSFATGALLGAALLALLPEAIERAGPQGAYGIGLTLVIGLGVFFVIEKVVLWWHTHRGGAPDDEPHGGHAHPAHDHRAHASGVLVLVGDSIHNALDGVLIASAFLGSTQLGLVTTFAVAAHEVPHRVGDFAILVQAGFSRWRALLLNLGTGLGAVIGALAAYYGLRQALGALPYALAFSVAGFLYIAVAGLIPGLQQRVDARTSAQQVLYVVLGIVVIAVAERLAEH
jgi:zinc and cadmium transporter